jgi:hypothetical protein
MKATATVLDYQLTAIKNAQHKVANNNTKHLILTHRDDKQKIKHMKNILGVGYVNSIINELVTELEDLK